MTGDTTADLRRLIELHREGDRAAAGQLVARSVDRLRRLSDAIVRRSFPAQQGHEDTVFQETAYRLLVALAAVAPADPVHLFRLAAQKVRQVLLDLTERQARPSPPASAEGESTADPARLAQWTEFHRRADALPPDQKEVFDLVFYAGLTQAEAAGVLGRHPRAVSRLWVTATEGLLDVLPDTNG